MLAQHDAEQAANGHAAAAPAASGLVNPFLSPAPGGALQPASAPKSRQNHVFLDQDGNEKRFGSALGLLTARFVDMILVSAILVSFFSCDSE